MGMTRRMQHYDVPEWQPLAAASPRSARSSSWSGIVLPDRPARRQHPPSRGAARRHRRSLGRPHAGMVDAPRRRRPSTSRCCRDVEGEDAYWGMKQRARREPAAAAPSPTTSRSKCRATARPASSAPSSRPCMGFALIWHIWWLVDRRPASAPIATFVVFAWRDRAEYVIPAEEVARIDRANRARAAGAARRSQARRHERRRSTAVAPRSVPHRPPRRSGHATAARPRRAAARAEAHHRRLRLLDLPAQRHRDVLGASSPPTRCCADATAGGPTGAQICSTSRTSAIETACLLLSSFTCGLASIGAPTRAAAAGSTVRMAVTCLLGAGFLVLEVHGVRRPGRRRAPARSAAPSCPPSSPWSAATACTSRVGLLWLLTMMAQVFAKGFRADILRRLLCFSLFWHALDIIWVAHFHRRLSDGSRRMSDTTRSTRRSTSATSRPATSADDSDVADGVRGYLVGLGLAVAADRRLVLRRAARHLVWAPSIPVALVVLAIAQMGVHLVFFLHITTGPGQHQQRPGARLRRADRLPVIVGSLWIMDHLDANMALPMHDLMPGMSY